MTEHKEDNTIEGPAAKNLRRVQREVACADSRPALDADWSYFFTHNARLKHIIQKLKADNFFPTFVHQSCNYIRNHDKVCKQLRPTISGLIFIQGEVKVTHLYSRRSKGYRGLFQRTLAGTALGARLCYALRGPNFARRDAALYEDRRT